MVTQIEVFQWAKYLPEYKESIIAFNKKSWSLAQILLEVPPNHPWLP